MTGLMMAAATGAQAESKGRVLVIVSSENRMALQDGKSYLTGYYLNELTVPVRAVMENGYDVTFANPRGNTPSMDEHSDTPSLFDNNLARYEDYRRFHASLVGLKKPRILSQVIREGLEKFDAVFFPGGHAPMIDLLENPDVHAALKHFHARGKPTAAICHGPISLLAALPNASEVVAALRARDFEGATRLSQGWIYADYQMTVFSTAEERVAEANQLGGKVQFYPDEALRTAKGQVRSASPWQSHAVRDRELITGQNPFSDEELAELLLQALAERAK